MLSGNPLKIEWQPTQYSELHQRYWRIVQKAQFSKNPFWILVYNPNLRELTDRNPLKPTGLRWTEKKGWCCYKVQGDKKLMLLQHRVSLLKYNVRKVLLNSKGHVNRRHIQLISIIRPSFATYQGSVAAASGTEGTRVVNSDWMTSLQSRYQPLSESHMNTV